jgi:alkylated DNA nucleotide flippase Atl1
MKSKRLRAVVEAIPPGRWASYGDVAVVAGSTNHRDAVGMNTRLTDMGHKCGHRVLRTDGSVPEKALEDPDGVRLRLAAEGVGFDERGRADREARLEREELEKLAA